MITKSTCYRWISFLPISEVLTGVFSKYSENLGQKYALRFIMWRFDSRPQAVTYFQTTVALFKVCLLQSVNVMEWSDDFSNPSYLHMSSESKYHIFDSDLHPGGPHVSSQNGIRDERQISCLGWFEAQTSVSRTLILHSVAQAVF
jgi:hypothetical protein